MPPPAPRLRAAIRSYRHSEGPVSGLVHHGGRYATALDRRILAGLVPELKELNGEWHCTMRLHSGVTLLWDLPDGGDGSHTQVFHGALPLRVTAFDRYCLLLADDTIDEHAKGNYALPAGASQVAITAVEPAADDSGDRGTRAAGWHAGSLFIQVNPIAFLGEEVVVRPRSSTYIRRASNLLACGLIAARDVVAQNLVTTEADQVERGWIDTAFPATVRSIGVSVRPDLMGAAAVQELGASVELFRPVEKSWAQLSGPPFEGNWLAEDTSDGQLRYNLPAGSGATDSPVWIRVQPHPHQWVDGVLGYQVDAQAAIEQDARAKRLRLLAPAVTTVRSVQSPELTEVKLTLLRGNDG